MFKSRKRFFSPLLVAFLLINVYCIQAGFAQNRSSEHIASELKIKKNLTDDQLLDLVQKQTFRYFWDFGHPVSGMARERSNRSYDYGDEVVTTGGTGFGIMATIAASERKFITR
ncbi:MAG: beta-glucosidase, partial [Pedobacter sp.]|nr:beta-glucosidase [Pedobacter sp.]